MDILKKINKQDNQIDRKLNNKDIQISNDLITSNKIILNKDKYSIIDYTPNKSLIYNTNLKNKDNIILLNTRKYNNNNIVTENISRKVYQLYINHFFNYLINNNIKIIKGRIFNYKRKKNLLYVGVNGLIIPISKGNLTYHSNKLYSYKKWSKGYSLYKLIKLSFFCENIKIENNKINVKISRKKFLKILNTKNATI